ncbi:MAG: hypothetical protein WDM77_06145 [Steroidobacteraceae bacterium]
MAWRPPPKPSTANPWTSSPSAQAANACRDRAAASRYNPIVNPQFAKARRTYVLRRMKDLGYIDAATAATANAEPVEARAHAPLFDVDAQYVAEMARQEVASASASRPRRRAFGSLPPWMAGCRRRPIGRYVW